VIIASPRKYRGIAVGIPSLRRPEPELVDEIIYRVRMSESVRRRFNLSRVTLCAHSGGRQFLNLYFNYV